jgi:hypothetical protein
MCSLTILAQSKRWRVLYHSPQSTTLYVEHPQMGKVVLKVVPGTRNTGTLQVRTWPSLAGSSACSGLLN